MRSSKRHRNGNFYTMNKPLLIFDFDGTLADCKELHQNAFRKAAEEVCPGIEYTNEELEALPTKEKIKMLLAKGYVFDADKLYEIKQHLTMANIYKYIGPDQQLLRQLNDLKQNYIMCVNSNATRNFVDKCLSIMKLNCFDLVCTATEFPAKPDTFMYEHTMKWSGVKTQDTTIFEDSIVGINAARNTGANVVEVRNVSHLKELLSEY